MPPALLLLVLVPTQAPPSRLAVLHDAPDFALTAQDGKPLAKADLAGKVVVVSFVFTTCNGTCPATTMRLAEAARLLDKEGVGPDRARFVSITLDPARDTPAALRKYMTLYEIDPRRWAFLTGPVAQVEKVHAAWGMWARPTPTGIDHPSRVFLVDGRGRVREIYNLDFLKPEWLAEDVRLLLAEGR